MEAKKYLLTRAGLKERQDRLKHLQVVARAENRQKIKEAKEQGDLSENAEYDAAREEQREIEREIAELDEILNNYEIVEDAEGADPDAIRIGSRVKILDIEVEEEMTYELTGATEANILEDKISNESPLGAAIIGAKVGDVISVEAPGGVVEYKILEIVK